MNWLQKRRYPELAESMVNLKSGTVFRGVIWKQRGGWVTLKKAVILQDRNQPINGNQGKPLDGEVVVPMSEIDFVQVLAWRVS